MPFVKTFTKLRVSQVPLTVTGFVLNDWPVAGAVIVAGLVGRGPGTTAFTVYDPVQAGVLGTPQSLADRADQLILNINTPTAKTKKVSKAYEVWL